MEASPQTSPETLRESVIACMDAAEDALLARADEAISSASQNRYFEVLGDLRNQRRALIDDFLQRWRTEAAAAPEAGSPADLAGRAFLVLDDACAVLDGSAAGAIDARFRGVMSRTLSGHRLRPEGRLALLKAIESRCLASCGDPQGGAVPAWAAALSGPGANLPEDAKTCVQAVRARVPEHLRDEHIAARLERFLTAWAALRRDSGLPVPALAVLDRLRGAFAAAWLLVPGWFADGASGLQLLGDLVALLPGIERAEPPFLPMLQRTLAVLERRPECLASVWLEWRFERERRDRLRQEWLESVRLDARHSGAVRAAEQQVREVCAQRMLGKRFPREVLALVRAGWSEVLMVGFLQPDDTGRMGRREAIRLLEELLDSVRPDLDGRARQANLQGLPQLMRSLRTGLEQTGMKAPQVNELLHGLRDVHGPLVFGRGDAARLTWDSVDVAWLDGTFPATAARPAAAPAGDLAGSWIEFAQDGPHDLQRYLVIYQNEQEDLAGLGNELHVVFARMPLSRLHELLACDAARRLAVSGSAVSRFGSTLGT